MEMAQPQVRLIAWTHFEPPPDVDWSTDADGGQALAEFAGRACYQSWSKPNPATATNATYLAHLLEVGHLSVLEHGTATFYLTGISRSLSHEFVRHRHFSYSQLSQRYVPVRSTGAAPQTSLAADAAMIEPEVIAADPDLHERFVAATEASVLAYEELLKGLESRMSGASTLVRKQARQAAKTQKAYQKAAREAAEYKLSGRTVESGSFAGNTIKIYANGYVRVGSVLGYKGQLERLVSIEATTSAT